MLDAGYSMFDENQIVFEVNDNKIRVRARAKKSLESATECGKVDAGSAAPGG
jgi:hypothetical protein